MTPERAHFINRTFDSIIREDPNAPHSYFYEETARRCRSSREEIDAAFSLLAIDGVLKFGASS